MTVSRSVLVVDDDSDVAATIAGALEQDGWRAETAMSLSEARSLLSTANPQILVVDIGLPDGSGMTFVRETAHRTDLGILVVSSRADEVDRVVGLELGADDYITKPFSVREVAARVRALWRRMESKGVAANGNGSMPVAAGPVIGPWRIGAVELDPQRLRVVGADGTELRLTGGEAGMLRLMLEADDRTVDRDTIAEQVLGHRLLPHQRGVDQLASMLRRKLATASGQQIQVLALRGRGYRLVA
jgi:DNA-binding response OmpR family regulator